MSNIKIMATTALGSENGVAVFQTAYYLTESYNGHINGGVSIPIGEMTESEFNLIIQQAVADKANAETSSQEWTASDVLGGRI